MQSNMKNRIYLGIFLKTLAVLMFQVCLMRILSITLWYHFAFLIISCALLGYGLSGSWLVFFERPRGPYWPSFLFAISLLPLVLLADLIQIKPALLSLSALHWFNILAVFILLTIPFFLSGLVLNTLFRNYPQQAFALYCFDLAGAACGTISFLIVSPLFRELEWIALISVFGFLASAALGNSRFKTIISFSLAVLFLITANLSILPEITVNEYKALPLALKHKNSRKIGEEWNAVSKVTWFKSPITKHAPGLSLNYQGKFPTQTGIALDNDMVTAASNRFAAYKEFVASLPISLVFELKKESNNSLILNALGADSILPALSTNTSIDLHFENSLLKNWHERQAYPPNVRFLSGTARSVLASESRLYDKIVVSLEGTLPSGLSGLDSLKSNDLYTQEGLESIFNRLSPDGWLTFHQYLLPPPRSELRLLATVLEGITRRGKEPKQHLGILQSVATLLIVYSPSKWNQNDTKTFQTFCNRNSFIPISYPGAPSEVKKKALQVNPLYAQPVYELLDDPQSFQTRSVFNLAPLNDDRPYFNVFLKLNKLNGYLAQFDYKWEAIIEGGLLIVLLLLFVCLFSAAIIGFPFVLLRRKWQFASRQTIYFIWIGLGFMCVEIALLEKLTLFLGEPVYSFTITLSCLLLASALGAGRVKRDTIKPLKGMTAWVVTVLLVFGVFFSKILANMEGLPFEARLFISVVLIMAIGPALGYFFPFGISSISQYLPDKKERENQIALAWCYNGVASVISSTGSIFICLFWGINYLFFLAALFYLLAYASSIKS